MKPDTVAYHVIKVPYGGIEIEVVPRHVAQELQDHVHGFMEETRDEFATSALNGMLAHPKRYQSRTPGENWHDAIAKEAYEIADAMMRARSRREV